MTLTEFFFALKLDKRKNSDRYHTNFNRYHDIILKIFKIMKTIFQSTASNRYTQQIDTYQKSGGRGSYEWERKQLKCKLRIM